MSGFAPTNKRLHTIHARMPGFPLEPMRMMRLTYHLQKSLRDHTNAALKPHQLADASYMVLAVLFGSDGETASASELGEACFEKPANLTRVCDDLQSRGLIARGERPGDRRAVMLTLTRQGRTLIEQALPDVYADVARACAVLSEAEMAQFAALSERLLDALHDPG